MIGINFDTATTVLANRCITWAENEVNKWLSKRYDIASPTFQTVSSIPPMVTSWTEWLSVGYMHDSNSRGSKDSFKRAKIFKDRAMSDLKLVSEYELDLMDSTGSIIIDKPDNSFQVLSNTDDYSNTFNEDDPLNWKIDSDKLSDIDSERS